MRSSWASRAPGRGTAVQDRRLAAVQGQAQVASEVGELRLAGRVQAVVVQARSPLSRRRAGRPPAARSPSQSASEAAAASWGWMPAAASSRSSARPSRPPRAGRNGVPARHQQPLDPGPRRPPPPPPIGRLERLGLEVGVAVDQAHAAALRPASRQPAPGLGLDAREERLGRAQPPDLAGLRAPGQLVEDGRPAVAVGAVRRTRSPSCASAFGAACGMNGAAASETSRQASTRSPRTARSRASASASPALAALASTHGCSGVDEPVRRPHELPQRRQRVVQQAAFELVAVGGQRLRPRPPPARPSARAPGARRRSSGWPSRSSGSAGCRSRSPGPRCSGARTSPS